MVQVMQTQPSNWQRNKLEGGSHDMVKVGGMCPKYAGAHVGGAMRS